MTSRTARRLLVIAAFAGASVAACAGCARAVHRGRRPLQAALSYAELTGYLGVSFCYDGQAYSFISTEIKGTEEAAVRAHEAKHREQAMRFPNCESFSSWYNTPRGTLEAESEAYWTGWCTAVALGADSTDLKADFIERIARKLGGEASRLSVVQAFGAYGPCPRP